EWRRVFDVNVLGMYLATRAVAPFMRRARRGRIINLASGTPYKGVPMFMHYVASKGAVIAMTRVLAKELGGDNVLVNTIAPGFTLSEGVLANSTQVEQLSVEEWKRVFDVNVLGMYLATRAVAPFMRQAGAGRIINLASGTPYKGVPFFLHYVASKGAVIAMTRGLAKELGGDNVLVNAVAPGFTMSDGVLSNPVQLEQLQEVSAKARVLVRDQYPEDVVGAVLFFAGEASSFITGQSLVVDGGAYFN
ncbi:MAG: SDR family oxidoreductase, partial [Solirubrobacterales bacterium]|nr:SDR family oxidoreductase [Solirubrobacterales bacterium]